MLAKLLWVLKKTRSSKFNIYIRRFQEKYNNSTNIDIDEFMCNTDDKYELLVDDGQWDTTSENYVEILALISQIQELKILLAKNQSLKKKRRKKWW